MQRLKYVWGKDYDEELPLLVNMVKKKIDGNDDYRLLIVGDTGTGKSSLALHITDLFCTKPVIETIGLNEKGYSLAVVKARDKRVKDKENYVNCVYDEANVYSTEVMKSFNREIMRLLGEIRGLNIFHIWCMPNPARLQQDFIDETFDGLIFIKDKSQTKPRVYYFLSKKDLDKLRKKEGTPSTKAKLGLDILNKVAKKYATYMGCFKEYKGVLKEDYDSLKTSKMSERVNDFFEKFGGKKHKTTDIAKSLGVTQTTIRKWVDRAIGDGCLIKDTDYSTNIAGIVFLTDEGLPKFEKYYVENKRKNHTRIDKPIL